MSTALRLAVLLLAGIVTGCNGIPPEESCAPRPIAELPMIENALAKATGSPIVSVEIGGQPRQMLVDTGGARSLLDPAVAASFEISFARSPYRLGLDAQPLDKVAHVRSVRIGPRRFGDTSFVVSPVGWTGVDGTLGANWLQTMDLEIDPAGKKIVFYASGDCESGAVRWTHKDLAIVPLHLGLADRQLTIPVKLDGKEIPALFDTGTPDTVLSLAAARRLFGLGPESPGVRPGYQRALREGNSEPSWRYQFSSLDIGGIVYDHPRVTLAQISGSGPELILGMEQLRRLHFFVAEGEQRLYATTEELSASDRVGVDDYLHAIEGLIDRQETDDAAARLDTLLGADPGNATAHMLRGALYDAKGDRAQGLREADQAIRLDPEFGGAYLVRSRLDAEAGDYDRAFGDANRAVRLLPKDAVALNTRCWYGAILGRLDAALADCDTALDLSPKDANILDSRALVHLKAGRLDEAIKDYDSALAIDPKIASSLYGRGLAERQKGDRPAGDVDIAAAEQAEPGIVRSFGK